MSVESVGRRGWLSWCVSVSAVGACVLSLPLQAEVFRCQQPDGSWLFTDAACPSGSVSSVVTLQENTALDTRELHSQMATWRAEDARRPERAGNGAILIEDSATRERNARVSKDLTTPKQKRKNKRRKGKGKRTAE